MADKIRIAEPKTRAAVRAITLSSWLVEAIAEHLAIWPISHDGPIFTAPEGG